MRVPGSRSHPGCWRWLLLIGVAIALTGCATSQPATSASRRFVFERDTFAYANELVWEYHYDEHGNWVHNRREPKPDYTHRCFVVARAAKQFFKHARFDPGQPVAGPATYRRLIRKVVSTSPRRESPAEKKIVIPGYASLRQFSRAQEKILKAECGGPWRSYFQRGHWRMIWPFSRHDQERMAAELVNDLKQNRPPVVHLVRFPALTINHAVLLFDFSETEKEIRFAAYDPNSPETAATVTYDRARRTFTFPTNFYFPGGRVDVYEIYRGCLY